MYPPPVQTLVVSHKGMPTGRLQPPASLSTVFSAYSRLVRGNNSSHYVPRQLDYPIYRSHQLHRLITIRCTHLYSTYCTELQELQYLSSASHDKQSDFAHFHCKLLKLALAKAVVHNCVIQTKI